MKLSQLELALDYHFSNAALLKQAVTHRSYGQPNNERLEFLGDGILNAAVARLLFDAFPRRSEGELSRLRASLVKKETLAELAQELGLSQYLLLGEGEVRSGGYQRPSILADAVEALFAAIYLDASFERATVAIARLISPKIAALDPEVHGKDNKTQLQEWLQARKFPLPRYTILRQIGEAHEQQFEVECRIDALNLVTVGMASSRRAGEQIAAASALAQLPQQLKGVKS